MDAFELLFEAAGLASQPLPSQLARLYPGRMGFAEPVLYANFVSSLDGVVALEQETASGAVISGRSESDRFLMGMLRAFSDAVLVGAGTVRAEAGHLWTPGFIYPPAAAAYAELRRQLGKPAEPRLVIVSASGEVEPHQRAIEAGALVLTSATGARRLADRVTGNAQVQALGASGELAIADVLGALRSAGFYTVLSEGGPHLIGNLLAGGHIDELFLTLSPVLAGRRRDLRRLGLVEGVALLPDDGWWGRLLSARRSGSHLFLRYDLRRQ